MIEGKGMFVHKLKSIPDPKTAAVNAFNGGFSHVLIKILDGVWKYNQRPYYENGRLRYADDIIQPYVDAFHEYNIEVYGWGWLYHSAYSRPADEAKAAIERVAKFGLDGYGIDAEADVKNKHTQSQQYANALAGNMDVPVFLSSYRYPQYHREVNYKAYLEVCDFVSPQVYWAAATNAGAQLLRTLQEWEKVLVASGEKDLPIIPTGSAYTERGWTAKAGEVLEFMRVAVDQGLTGCNFWVWHHAENLGLWKYIAEFPWPTTDPVPPPQVPPTDPTSPSLADVAVVVGRDRYVGTVPKLTGD
jgi:hypothetical protein